MPLQEQNTQAHNSAKSLVLCNTECVIMHCGINSKKRWDCFKGGAMWENNELPCFSKETLGTSIGHTNWNRPPSRHGGSEIVCSDCKGPYGWVFLEKQAVTNQGPGQACINVLYSTAISLSTLEADLTNKSALCMEWRQFKQRPSSMVPLSKFSCIPAGKATTAMNMVQVISVKRLFSIPIAEIIFMFE